MIKLLPVFLSVFSFSALASELCAVRKNIEPSYVSAGWNEVVCNDGSFKTVKREMFILIPGLNSKLLKDAESMMINKKLKKVSLIDTFGFDNYSYPEHEVLIYDKNGNRSPFVYCTASKINPLESGINNRRTVYDVNIRCQDNYLKESFTGVSVEEVKAYMKDLGFDVALNLDSLNHYMYSGAILFKKLLH